MQQTGHNILLRTRNIKEKRQKKNKTGIEMRSINRQRHKTNTRIQKLQHWVLFLFIVPFLLVA